MTFHYGETDALSKFVIKIIFLFIDLLKETFVEGIISHNGAIYWPSSVI